jgi:O-antigen/teichoic acid export membrane protein
MSAVAEPVRRFAGNALSVLTSDVVTRASTFAIYALVARRLGATAFGELSLALTLFATFQVFSVAGLKTLVARAISKDRSRTSEYLVNASMVVVVSSMMSLAALALFLRLMRYAPGTSGIVLLLSLALLPYSLCTVCEAVFQAWERMHLIAYANVPVNFAKIGLAALLLTKGHGLYSLVLLLLGAQLSVLAVEWWMLWRYIGAPTLSVDPRFALSMVGSTGTFLGSDAIIAIYGNLNIVLVARFLGEKQAGFYNAATQVLVPVLLSYQSVVFTVFPALCRRFALGTENLKGLSNQLLELLVAVGAPITVGVFFLADTALLALYSRKEFLPAVPVLRVMVWTLVLTAFTSVFGEVLIASHHEKGRLRIVAFNGVTALVAGLVLVPSLGLIGAAIALVLTKIVDLYQHYRLVSKLMSAPPLGRLTAKPLVASAFMAAFLWYAKGQNGILFTIAGSSAVYTVILLVLAMWSAGGPRELKAKYLYGWFE